MASEQNFELNYAGDKGPILATFQNNIPPLHFIETKNESDLLNFNYIKENGKATFNGENAKSQFIGKSAKLINKDMKYLIGIIDKSNKRINVYDIEEMFNMRQVSKKKIKTEDQENVYNNLNALEQKQMLVAEFGTKKSKKKMQQMLNNVVEEKNISSSHEIKGILQEKAEILEKEHDQQEKSHEQNELNSKREFLPDFNLQTTEASKIYDLHSIISHDEWSDLTIKFALRIIKKQDTTIREPKYYTDYVFEKLSKFDEIFAKSAKININSKIKILLYLDILLKMFRYRVVFKSPEEVAKETSIKPVFLFTILSKFYRKNAVPGSDGQRFKYNRDKTMDDKLICYIIVLALIFYDFKFDALELMQTLKLEKIKFISYCKEIGCAISNKTTKATGENIIIELKAPLVLLVNKMDDIKKFKKK